MRKLIDTSSLDWDKRDALYTLLDIDLSKVLPPYIIIETIEEL